MDALEKQKGPGPTFIRHGQRYLRGCLNEEGAELWTTAIGLGLKTRGALDAVLTEMSTVYVQWLEGRRVIPGYVTFSSDMSGTPERSEAP